MNNHHHLETLDETRTNWRLKVRVTRMWLSLNNTGGIRAHNLILLDCLNSHILATVRPKFWHNYQNIIHEGGLYEIVNVVVRPTLGIFRPVSSNNCLFFIHGTIVNALPHDYFSIPRHKFELKPLGRLHDIVNDYGFAENQLHSTDVIGVMEDLQPLRKIQTLFGPREIVQFRIRDGSTSLGVSFWGPLNANTTALYGDDLETPIILILASVRLSQSRGGKIQLSNLPSSKIFVNLNIADVFFMRHRLLNE